MAPSKRAAPQTKATAGPKAKVPKVEAVPEVEPFVAECAPVRELIGFGIGEDAKIPAECREMLEAMATHCLKTPQGERHEFQERMAGVIAEIAGNVEAERRAAVDAAETQVGNAGTEKEAVDAAMAKVEALVNENNESCDLRAAALKASEEAAAAAGKALEVNLEEEVAVDQRHKENLSQKAEIENILSEKWEPVKEGTAFSGAQWRDRNKAIDAALQPLFKLGLDESLMNALPVALKLKPEARGKFAQIALEAGDEAFAKQIAALSEKIAGVDTERQERSQAVAAAEATVKTTEEQQTAAATELSAAKEKLAAEQCAWGAAVNAVKDQEKRAKQVVKDLASQKEHLAVALELSAKFMALRERVAVEEVAAEAEAEAVAMELEPTPAVVEAI